MGIDQISACRDYVSDQSRAVWVQVSQQAGMCTHAALLCLRTRLIQTKHLRIQVDLTHLARHHS